MSDTMPPPSDKDEQARADLREARVQLEAVARTVRFLRVISAAKVSVLIKPYEAYEQVAGWLERDLAAGQQSDAEQGTASPTCVLTWLCPNCGERREMHPFSYLALAKLASTGGSSNDRRITLPRHLLRHHCRGGR